MTGPDRPGDLGGLEVLEVLVVEPWYGGSHRAWADGLAAHSRHRVRLLTMEPAFWRWRMRGGALTLARATAADVDAHGRPDVVLVSDLVDLAAYLGHTRSVLAGVPVALYLHENQLVHPPGRRGEPDERYAAVNWASMAAADHVFCNSDVHRRELLAALPAFLDRAPDHRHTPFVEEVAARTSVLPVGVDLTGIVDGLRPTDHEGPAAGAPPRLVWNQRWDHDKDPEALFRVVRALVADGVELRVALAGENRRSDPQEFDRLRAALGDRVEVLGHLPRPEYVALLLRSDVVVSVARHELFGIAAVEAMAAGAVPLLPDRLSYPELLPPAFHDACLYRSRLYDHLGAVLADLPAARARVAGLREAMAVWSWPSVVGRYDEALAALAGAGPRPGP